MGKNTIESITFGSQNIKKMAILWIILFGFILVTAFQASAAAESKAATKITPVDQKTVIKKAMKLQLPFIANQGQIHDSGVRYYAKTFGGTVYVTDKGELIYTFVVSKEKISKTKRSTNSKNFVSCVLKEMFVDASSVTSLGSEPAQTKVNYFIGNDKSKWKTNISTFNSVSLGEIYKGIELSLKAYAKSVEKIFTVKPGADPNSIKLKMEGAKFIKINKEGELELETDSGVVRFSKPFAYQNRGGERSNVEVAYSQDGGGYGFKVGAYDKTLPLIIDPVLIYSTFLGGASSDWGYGIAVDVLGRIYMTGSTDSSDFPTQGPIQGDLTSTDVFVVKFNSDGSALEYATYLGGSGVENGNDIAVGSGGNAYIIGTTSSNNFPMVYASQPHGGGSDVFVAKLSSVGSALEYSTCLGGINFDAGWGIAVQMVDGIERTFVTGQTQSDDFPTWYFNNTYQDVRYGVYDAFVSRLYLDEIEGQLVFDYFTYFGGSSEEYGRAIAVDSNGDAYVTGETTTSHNAPVPFPLVNAIQSTYGGPIPPSASNGDAFISKFSFVESPIPTLSLDFSTYLGGTSRDYGMGIAVSGSYPQIYVTGSTNSTEDFPTQNPILPSGYGFAARIDMEPSPALVYSTYIGGSGYGIALDWRGCAYVAGTTSDDAFPQVHPLQGDYGGGVSDAFVAKISANGSKFDYWTYLGGSGNDAGFAIAADTSGNAYVTGHTYSEDFPIANAIQETYGGGSRDAFVALITPSPIYVDSYSGDDTNGGTGWGDALATIQEAVDRAVEGVNEIWVAAGNYTVTATIEIDKDVAIYGGFNGTESVRQERNWESNLTIVDGMGLGIPIFFTQDSEVVIDGFAIQNGNIWIEFVKARINNCTFSNCRTRAIYLHQSASTITNCKFVNNLGGAIYSSDVSMTTVNNCVFINNSADEGGAIAMYYVDQVSITNSIFYENSAATDGGAIYLPMSTGSMFLQLTNCTFYGNNATNYGGAIFISQFNSFDIINSVLWGNTASTGSQIYVYPLDPSIPPHNITYCNVEGGGFTGTGNIGANPTDEPLFVNPTIGDFRLTADSPGIDAGNNSAANIPDFDFEGEQRIVNGTVDMGADEFVDTDTDQLPDSWEFEHFGNLSYDGTGDPDGDGLNNAQEIQDGTDPNNPDTDGDNHNDGREIAMGTDPLLAGDYHGIPDIEYYALVDIFNYTTGAIWFDRTNWLQLSDTIDECDWHGISCVWVGNDATVTIINLSTNNLVGTLPATLADLTGLQNLRLSSNQISGSIPSTFGNLADLVDLYLEDNQISGFIPPELGNLSSLLNLVLHDNELTGSIPVELGNLSNLQALNLANNQLQGPIPPELGNLSELYRLNLNGNQLDDPIPPELGTLSNLLFLSLSNNQLSGSIPVEIGDLANLQTLELHNNNLSGTIPAELGDLSHLNMLALSGNQLTGAIPPELGSLSNLVWFWLSSNQLTGTIPPDLGNLSSVQQLYLDQNQLTGNIPPELGDLDSIQFLNLSRNQLTGSIPSELGNIASLQHLHLYNNQLSGSIPAELGNLSSLRNLILENNQLTGAIPAQLGSLSSLENLRLRNNQLSGNIPAELGNLTNLATLDLHVNRLTGNIPPELGSLTNLWHLYLGSNQLTGYLPSELGNLTNLRHFVFGHNRLSGPIPQELGELTNLTFLVIMDNRLIGPIPASLLNLTSLTDDINDFRFNALCTNNLTLDEFLQDKQDGGDWYTGQITDPDSDGQTICDGDLDNDNDGISDADELILRTDPISPDTDGDGLTDYDEVNVYTTNPTNPDHDGDGVSDGVEVAVGTNPIVSDAPPAYDEFGLSLIDRTRWRDLEFIRRVSGGQLESAVRSYGYSVSNNLPITSPGSHDSIAADITITNVINDGVHLRARLQETLYNTYYTTPEPGFGMEGDVFAQAGIRDSGSGLRFFYKVLVCENAACTAETALVDENITSPVPLEDTPYRVALQWEDETNLLTIAFPGYAPIRINPTLSVSRAGDANTAFMAIGTRVSDLSNSTAGGYIAALFGTVNVDGSPYDIFPDPWINNDPNNPKWAADEFVRRQDSGQMELAIKSRDVNNSNNLNFIDTESVTAFSADVTFVDSQGSGGIQQARVVGGYFNDGTPGDGRAGDIVITLQLREDGADLQCRAVVVRCLSGDCNVPVEWEVLPGQDFTLATGLNMGQTYRLTQGWDQLNHRYFFGFDDLAGTQVTVFSGPLPAVQGPPRLPLKAISTRVMGLEAGDWGYAFARFDNVIDLSQDSDGDGVPLALDNCPDISNPDQKDTDGDRFGNACDDDDDNDGVLDVDEHADCVEIFNPILPGETSQPNLDGDGIPDACDPDADGDGVNSFAYGGLDCEDLDPSIPSVTPCVSSPGSGSPSGDSTGPPDFDGDGKPDTEDNCPSISNRRQNDDDNDGIGNECDPCPNDNTNDIDLDGVCGAVDNCPDIANANQADSDGDSQGDACDTDADGDGAISIYHGGNDCNDHDASINPSAGPDNDCDPFTSSATHQIMFENLTFSDGSNYHSWLPKLGDSITFEVVLDSGSYPIVDNTWHVDVTPAAGGARSITNNAGEYFNDPDRDMAEDFTFTVSDTADPKKKEVTISCNDYAGSITIYAQVQVDEAPDSRPLVGARITLPKDSDGDGMADAWETKYGDLLPNEDDDKDELTNIEEYRGFKWGPALAKFEPQTGVSDDIYQTTAYVPQGDALYFRTDPTRPDLFGKVVGYDFNIADFTTWAIDTTHGYDEPKCSQCIFALGEAYFKAGIDVHVLSLNKLPAHMEADKAAGFATDVEGWEKYTDASGVEHYFIRTVQINNRLDKPMSGTDGHINKKGIRDWTWDTKGWSGIANELGFGLGTTTYWISLYNYVYDSPYKEQDPTIDGELNPITLCEDENDNGINDQIGKGPSAYWEAGCNGCSLDDDLYMPGSYTQWGSTFDIDRDFRVELPVMSDPSNLTPGLDPGEYTIPQILKSTITHEWGHAIGTDHDGDPSGIMYHISNNWERDDKFSQFAIEQMRFFNH